MIIRIACFGCTVMKPYGCRVLAPKKWAILIYDYVLKGGIVLGALVWGNSDGISLALKFRSPFFSTGNQNEHCI